MTDKNNTNEAMELNNEAIENVNGGIGDDILVNAASIKKDDPNNSFAGCIQKDDSAKPSFVELSSDQLGGVNGGVLMGGKKDENKKKTPEMVFGGGIKKDDPNNAFDGGDKKDDPKDW